MGHADLQHQILNHFTGLRIRRQTSIIVRREPIVDDAEPPWVYTRRPAFEHIQQIVEQRQQLRQLQIFPIGNLVLHFSRNHIFYHIHVSLYDRNQIL